MDNHQSKPANRRMLWSLGFGGFLVNADNRAISPMLPAMAMALHTSASAVALLVTAYSIPYGIFQLAYGPIADRIGKVNTILMALCLFAVGTIACGVVDSFSWLLVLRVVTGMFAAGIMPTTLAQIGDRFAIAERPRAIAFFMSFSTSGQALGIVIGGLVAQFFSYRILFIAIGLAAIPAGLTLLRQRRAGHVTAPVAAAPLWTRYRALARNRRAWLIYGLVLCEGLVFYAGFTFLGVYGVTSLHLTYLIVGILTATYSLGAFVGSRTITPVLRMVGALRMPVLGSGLMALGFALIWGLENVIALIGGFIILGFGFSYCHSTLQTFATDLLPNGRATAISFFAFSLFLGSGIGPILAGHIVDAAGMRTMLGSVAGGMAAFCALCVVFLWLPALRRRNSPKEIAL